MFPQIGAKLFTEEGTGTENGLLRSPDIRSDTLSTAALRVLISNAVVQN